MVNLYKIIAEVLNKIPSEYRSILNDYIALNICYVEDEHQDITVVKKNNELLRFESKTDSPKLRELNQLIKFARAY